MNRPIESIRLAAVASNAPIAFAVLLGIVMPVVNAIAFPTYMHQMPNPAWEWTRLLEMPFVFFEIGVIMWASHLQCDREALWRNLPKDIRWTAIVFAICMFAGSSLLSSNPAGALTMSLITVIHGLFAVSTYQLFMLSRARGFEQFLSWHGAGLLVLALYTAWWFSFPAPPSEVMGGEIEWGAALPGFISVRHFGAWTGAFAAGFAAQVLFGEPSDRLRKEHFFYFVAAALTIWSGTRAAIVGIIIVVPILALALGRLPRWVSIGRASWLTGAALLTAWIFLWDKDGSFFLWNAGELDGLDQATSGRTELWKHGIAIWLESPLLGRGTGSFFWEYHLQNHTQPHNVFVQFLVSWGLIGALSALWIIGRAVRAAHKAAKSQPVTMPMLAVLYCLLFQSLLEGMLHYPRFIMAIIVMIAMILAVCASHRSTHRQPTTTVTE
ncbi:O-antigen ligase family protein [Altererythrobacter sp.]|nr:O-antigen ligase family protein [Altererythrobacter sp.]